MAPQGFSDLPCGVQFKYHQIFLEISVSNLVKAITICVYIFLGGTP